MKEKKTCYSCFANLDSKEEGAYVEANGKYLCPECICKISVKFSKQQAWDLYFKAQGLEGVEECK